jgi:methyl-accepting chemotaxis protein
MANRAFFAFAAAVAGYVIAKVKGAQKDERIDRQAAALCGVARAVEEFQERLNRKEPLTTEDPKALKKAIAYRVSRGREELDEAIGRMRESRETAQRQRSVGDAARAAAKAVLP